MNRSIKNAIHKRFLVYVMQQELRDFFSSMNGELLVETWDWRDAVINITHALFYYHFYYNIHAQLELHNEQKHGPLSYLQHLSTNLIAVNIYVCYLHTGTLTCCLNIYHAVQLFQDIKHHVRQKQLVNLAIFYSTLS